MTLSQIAELVGGRLEGPPDLEIGGPVGLDAEVPGGIAFAESAAYLAQAENSPAFALLLPEDLKSESKPYIAVAQPRGAFLKLLRVFDKPLPLNSGVHDTAAVDSSALLDATASVGPYAVIERGARVGPRSRIHAFVYIGEGCEIAEDCTLFPHAVLYANIKLGARTIVHAGAVLGADGFGYAPVAGKRVKVPQIGIVEVGEDCEIGALTTIDRATLGSTKIGSGTKIDNLVQVAHNVQIGRDCAIAGQSGIAGSSKLGDRVLVAGQAGVGDHVNIASDVVLEARSAALQDLAEPGHYIGTPARPGKDAKRALLLVAKLPELFSRLRKVERRLEDE